MGSTFRYMLLFHSHPWSFFRVSVLRIEIHPAVRSQLTLLSSFSSTFTPSAITAGTVFFPVYPLFFMFRCGFAQHLRSIGHYTSATSPRGVISTASKNSNSDWHALIRSLAAVVSRKAQGRGSLQFDLPRLAKSSSYWTRVRAAPRGVLLRAKQDDSGNQVGNCLGLCAARYSHRIGAPLTETGWNAYYTRPLYFTYTLVMQAQIRANILSVILALSCTPSSDQDLSLHSVSCFSSDSIPSGGTQGLGWKTGGGAIFVVVWEVREITSGEREGERKGDKRSVGVREHTEGQ